MLIKLGQQLKITATTTDLQDFVVEKEKAPTTKVLEPKRSDFIYFRARAISAGDQGPEKGMPNPNGNGDYFPRKELEASYQTFIGRNLFLNHESDHPVKSIGKIVDSYAVEDPESGEFYIECFSKIDKKLHPEIARKIETGELDKVSMGCSCEESMCSICGTSIHSDQDQKCDHLSPHGILKMYIAEQDLPDYGIRRGERMKAFSINKGLSFNELSIVNVPADSSAVIKTVIANLRDSMSKKASLTKEEQLDLYAQFEKLLAQFDANMQEKIKEQICACEVPKEDTTMSETPKTTSEQDEQKQILSKLNGYEYQRLMESIEKRQKSADKKEEKPVEVKAEVKETQASVIDKIFDKIKNSLAGKMVQTAVERELGKVEKAATETPATAEVIPANDPKAEVVAETKVEAVEVKPETIEFKAEFAEDDDLLKSTWTLYEKNQPVLKATLSDIWDDSLLKSKAHRQWFSNQLKNEDGKTYAEALIDRAKVEGVAKIAELWSVAYSPMNVKDSKVDEPAKSEFVKPGTETKADKEAVASDKALDKVDGTEVATHLEDSKPESEKKEAAQVKVAEPIMEEPKVQETTMDLPKTDEPVMEAPKMDEPKPEGEEECGSAFDKLQDKVVISDGLEARKDEATKEIVVTDKEGKEVKRIPDGFGDDLNSVIKLLQSIMGVEEHKEEDALKPEEAPMPEVKPEEAAPEMHEAPKEDAMFASQKAELEKRAAELNKKEEEIKAEQNKIAAAKFSTSINARIEHCKKIVEAMVAKDVLPLDKTVVEEALNSGLTVLEARAEGIKHAANQHIKKLLTMDEVGLKAFEEGVNSIKKVSNNTKLSTPLFIGYEEKTLDDELKSIFDSMGTGKNPFRE